MSKPCTNHEPCLKWVEGKGGHSQLCEAAVRQGAKPKAPASRLLDRAGVKAKPEGKPVGLLAGLQVVQGDGAIGCGCGKVTVPSRTESKVVDGVEHRYGYPCIKLAPLPERAGREGDQPLPVVGGESVFAAVRERIDEREAIGIRRYGRSLETFNGRNAFRDLQDELLDGMNYATQAEMEHRAVVEALLVLARAHRPSLPRPTGAEVDAALSLAAKLETGG